MEALKDHPTPYPGKGKQRVGFRSSHKEKEDKVSSEIKATPKRDKRLLSVSKSVSQLDLSVKDKPPKSTRRLSVPSKYATPVTKIDKKLPSSIHSSTISENKSTSKPDFVVGPLISENKGKVTAKSLSVSFQGPFGRTQGRVNGASKNVLPTPTTQEVPKPGQKKKFNTLMSASYWLTQIKVAECAGKHVISLGFFKLALESTSEPLQRVRDELKSYTKRHNLLDLGEVAKEVLQNYGVLEEVIAEVEAKPEPKENVTLLLEACPLIPENVEEGEEESNSGSDCKDSIKTVSVECSPKVKIGKAKKAIKSDSNRHPSTEKVDDNAEKSEVLPSPIDRNKTVQRIKNPSVLPGTKSQPSILRKSINPIEKASVNSQKHAARRTSMTPAMTKTGQNGSQKDKGSNMNKPSQLDPPSSMASNTEQDKENLDFQQTESASIHEDSLLFVQD